MSKECHCNLPSFDISIKSVVWLITELRLFFWSLLASREFFYILSRHSYPLNYLSFGYSWACWLSWLLQNILATIIGTPTAPKISKTYYFLNYFDINIIKTLKSLQITYFWILSTFLIHPMMTKSPKNYFIMVF